MKSILKKIAVLGLIVFTALSVIHIVSPNKAFAENLYDCRQFLGMQSWDCGLNSESPDIKEDILRIAFNISIDITVIAAYLIIAYVIYGGYLYVLSGGDPSKVSTGKKTLTHGFIGLGITMSANIIINIIRSVLMASNENENLTKCIKQDWVTGEGLFLGTLQWAIGIGGFVAVIFIVYGGISYMTSSGDSAKLKKAKDMILYALIGLAIVALAEIIIGAVASNIRSAINP